MKGPIKPKLPKGLPTKTFDSSIRAGARFIGKFGRSPIVVTQVFKTATLHKVLYESESGRAFGMSFEDFVKYYEPYAD